MGWTTGFQFPAEAENFSLHHRIQTLCEAHPASYSMRNEGLLPEGKVVGSEADHLPPSGAEVKNARSYTFTVPYVFMAWC
jgi:hypothetical protein